MSEINLIFKQWDFNDMSCQLGEKKTFEVFSIFEENIDSWVTLLYLEVAKSNSVCPIGPSD